MRLWRATQSTNLDGEEHLLPKLLGWRYGILNSSFKSRPFSCKSSSNKTLLWHYVVAPTSGVDRNQGLSSSTLLLLWDRTHTRGIAHNTSLLAMPQCLWIIMIIMWVWRKWEEMKGKNKMSLSKITSDDGIQ